MGIQVYKSFVEEDHQDMISYGQEWFIWPTFTSNNHIDSLFAGDYTC